MFKDTTNDFLDLLNKDISGTPSFFDLQYPFSLKIINYIIFSLIFIGGYFYEKLVAPLYNKTGNYSKEIIGTNITYIILISTFIFIFGNYANTFSYKKPINMVIYIISFFGISAAYLYFKQMTGIDNLSQDISKLFKGKKVNTIAYINISLICTLIFSVLTYGIYNSWKNGILLSYLLLLCFIVVIFIITPIYDNSSMYDDDNSNDKQFITKQIMVGVAITLNILCRFDGIINSFIGGLLGAVIVGEISWPKKQKEEARIKQEKKKINNVRIEKTTKK